MAVGKPPEVREIEDTLEEMQAIVGGYIEMVTLEDDVDLVCNEEGKFNGLPPNREVAELLDVIAGDFFITRRDAEGGMMSLTDDDVRRYSERFAE